jgi:formate-dependent nitrite reductase membrane component NrfD
MSVSALLWWNRFDGTLTTIAAPGISVLFISLTAAVLVIDLERPERFYYILTRSNWRSWMVWGAWFLTAHGLLGAIWLVGGWFDVRSLLDWLVWPAVLLSILATAYTAFLFAQGHGRDLWQGPWSTIDLVAQSGLAGSAILLLVAVPTGASADAITLLVRTLAGSLIAHVLILIAENVLAPSPTRHHQLAVDTIRRGVYAPFFWWGAIVGGGLVPALLLVAAGPTSGATLPTLASVLALVGGAAWEYVWVEAGQSVPLS